MDQMIMPRNAITFLPAPVHFPGYAAIKAQATDIAEYIRSVELTDDNVKDVKAILASARKITKELNSQRISIEKEILTEYREMKAGVDEIIGIIDDADKELRDKVKELEEEERNLKKMEISAIWNKRAWSYQINDLLPNAFDRWLTPQHLNKSVSLKKVETDMVEWLEERERDIEALKRYDDSYLVEYLGCLNLTQTLTTMQERDDIRTTISENREEPLAVFTITGTAHIRLARMLLDDAGINYKMEEK